MNVGIAESWTVFTPLGLRFWDSAQQRIVPEGLNVRCWPVANIHQQTQAYRTRSDVYSFRWLPGMRSVEHRFDDPERFPGSPPHQRRFVVAVADPRHRFLDTALEITLPLEYRGVYQFEGLSGSPVPSLPGVPLFSAPTRALEPKLALLRGTLVLNESASPPADPNTLVPAAWARIRIGLPGGRGYHGIADEAGRFLVAFPYPPVVEGFNQSPGIGGGAAIFDRGWDITLSVNFEPNVLAYLPGSSTPELGSILQQRQGAVWPNAPTPSDTAVASWPLRLQYGEELVVRSAGDDVHQLYINQAV